MRGRVATTRAGSAVLLALGLSAASAHQTVGAETEEHEHANEVAAFLGGTTENDETHFTIGAEYERRLGERFGLGLVVEHVSQTDAWVLLAPFSYRPLRGRGLKVYAGPGIENKVPEPKEAPEAAAAQEIEEHGRESFFVARAGVGWALELGRLSVTPQIELDCVREDHRWDKALVFGVAVGRGF